jgi:hypothetical protein
MAEKPRFTMQTGFVALYLWQRSSIIFRTLLISGTYCDNIHIDAAQDAFCAASQKPIDLI